MTSDDKVVDTPQFRLAMRFPLSVSYSSGQKVLGRNFILTVTVAASSEEECLQAVIRRELVSKVHSKDLGEHVDWFQGKRIDERVILCVFWNILAKALSPVEIVSLKLERGAISYELQAKDPKNETIPV